MSFFPVTGQALVPVKVAKWEDLYTCCVAVSKSHAKGVGTTGAKGVLAPAVLKPRAAVRFRPRNILSIPRLVDQLSALLLVKTRP